ncbi:MAG: HAMP domain-containing sensor histidine kinase [Bacteroidota bacterium]
MRLLLKTTIFYLLLALSVFGIGGFIAYFVLQDAMRTEMDYELRRQLRYIARSIEEGQSLESLTNRRIQIAPVSWADTINSQNAFTDTLFYHPVTDQLEVFRKLEVVRVVKDIPYHFTIIDIFIEEEDMIDSVVLILSRIFIILTLTFLVGSFVISRWLLKPFQGILQAIQHFRLRSDTAIELPSTSIREFRQLNHFVAQMTDKARQDYQNLKEFSENASHEMQTPLAIARGKLELLLASPDLKPEQLGLIDAAQQAMSRLSKLNQALTLLSKIENREFVPDKAIDFPVLFKRELEHFGEIAALKEIRIEPEIDPQCWLYIHESLAEVLISNLLKNAIQHNEAGGWVRVYLDQTTLRIDNSGPEPEGDPKQFFERFRKASTGQSNLGLGLAIVHKICDLHRFQIDYQFVDHHHSIQVNFAENILP